MIAHLVEVERDEAEFVRALIEVIVEAGVRVGWLDIGSAGPIDPGLESVVASGAIRAVAVGPGRSVAVKVRVGPAVLEDLVGEYFKGCRLVLLVGVEDTEVVRRQTDPLPRLRRKDRSWQLTSSAGESRTLSPEALLEALRRPVLR